MSNKITFNIIISLLTLPIILNPFVKSYSQTSGKKKQTIVFKKTYEPNEKAFTFLLPQGWITEGGIYRVNPTTQGGSGQSIEAKLNMKIMKDESGSVMTHWMPDYYYFDMTNSPARSMFPVGSNYNGMTVMPKMNPFDFIKNVIIPFAHKNIKSLDLIDQKPLPELVQKILQEDKTGPSMGITYYAGVMTVSYIENEIKYKEIIVTAVMDFGQIGAGLWKNRYSFLVRTPFEETDKWKGIFGVILGSIELNPVWVMGELKGEQQRGKIAYNTQKELEELDKQMVEHRRQTNAEIQNSSYLALTGKEEYVNPFTHQTEVGTNEWNQRWENENGDIIYTDNINYDPNSDPNLQIQGFKKSQVKGR